jgi:hypothetical protein
MCSMSGKHDFVCRSGVDYVKALSRAELAAVGVDARMAKIQIVMLSKRSLMV